MGDKEIPNVKISPGGSEKTVAVDQMPLRILALADLAPGRPPDGTSININKDNFDEVMGRLTPKLCLDVSNRMGQGPKEISVGLTFTSLKSFRPEAVASQVDGLSELLEIRRLLVALGNQEVSHQEFQDRIKGMEGDSLLLSQLKTSISSSQGSPPPTPPTPEPISKTDSLDSLFRMVDISSDSLSTLDDLIAQIVYRRAVDTPVDKRVVERFIGEIDALLGSQLNEILHKEEFQRLESAWRGLKFLVERTDFRKGIRIEIMSLAKDQLRDILYTNVFKQEYDGLTPDPLSVMIADYQFDRLPQDIEALKDISRMAQSLQVPFITSVAPGFFGMKSFIRLPALAQLREKFKGPEYVKWNSFRQSEESLWTMLTVNRFLSRFPYGQDTIPVKGFRFEEDTDESWKYLWTSAVWIIASAITHSFAEDGWCTDIYGQETERLLEPLPTREYKISQGQKTTIPLEVLIPEQRQSEFAEIGLSLLACRPESSSAYIHSVPSAHSPKRYKDPVATSESIIHATLPYQLVAGRLSHYLSKIKNEIRAGSSREDIEKVFRDKMLAFIAPPGEVSPDESVVVQVTEDEENPSSYNVILRIRPVFKIMGKNIDLLLGWSGQF